MRTAPDNMKSLTRIYVMLALAVAVVIVLVYLLTPRAPDWKLVSVSFGGFTNRAAGPSVALSVQNRTGAAIKVMDHYYVESPEMPSYAATNHIIGAGRRLPTGTNMVVAVGQTRRLLIPVPSDGNRWRVSLEFARANLQTRLAEYLQKPHGTWTKYVPEPVRAIYIVRSAGCEISTDAK